MYSHKLVGTGALIDTKVSGLGGYMTYFPMNMVEQTSTNVSLVFALTSQFLYSQETDILIDN